MSLIKLKNFVEDEGILYPIEFKNLLFIPKRVFYVTDVPKGETRGKHAHYKNKQYLICANGQLKVGLHDGKELKEYALNKGEAVYVPELVWDYQTYMTGNDIMISICSDSYDPSDYICSFEEFIKVSKK